MKSLLILLIAVGVALCTPATFHGEQVYRIFPQTEEQTQFLRDLQDTDVDLDFWLEPGGVRRPVDVRLTVDQIPRYLGKFQSEGIQTQLIIPDVQALIQEENFVADNMWSDWTQFESLEEIENFLVETAERYSFVTLESIGESYEGRNIWLLRINKNPSDSKKKAFLDSNIHAREWVTSASMTWMINELLETDSPLLDVWDLHIVPMFNPDGYVWSTDEFRMWRKTRSVNSGSSCFGADPNRNWDKSWSGPGTSANPCSDTYHGTSAFSEPETKAGSDYISAEGGFDLYLSYHSYSQYVLMPYGDTFEPPPDYDELKRVGDLSVAAITGTGQGDGIWECDTVPNLLYLASGGSMDWVKAVAGVDYSYTFELRDRGFYGFILPPSQIIPAAIETYAGTLAFLNELS